jgi:hypothetical protein
VTLYENSVLQDGGLLSNNWAYVNGGCFTQAQGKTFIDYAMHIGYAAPGNLKARCVHVSGGTLDVRRFHVGVANAEDDPGVLEVAAGRRWPRAQHSWESSESRLRRSGRCTIWDSRARLPGGCRFREEVSALCRFPR